MTTTPAVFQGDDDTDLDRIFDRWWALEVHPTVKPSVHARTTHVAFARAALDAAREGLQQGIDEAQRRHLANNQ